MAIGYEFLRIHLGLPIPPVSGAAAVQPVTRVARGLDGSLAVPASVAPQGDDVLAHLLFALRYEGVDLLVLSHALPHVPAEDLRRAVLATPSGQFVRKAGYLWEHFNAQVLEGVTPGGTTVALFDPALYLTGPSSRDARWRVAFNGLGSLRYGPTVRRRPDIERLLARDLLGLARQFADEIGPELLDRALAWAYLGETESSFAIEREVPTADKTRAFAALLQQAGQAPVLSEDVLVAWQNAVITNPLEHAQQFRAEQNWLRGAARGAAGVTYVPPPPEVAADLMEEWLAMVNRPDDVDPLVKAALACFGFVFIHPFMDGNGRLSRFLVHHVLGRSGRLPRGFVLPVSIAMKRHEADYLRALQGYSRPVRALWSVLWIDQGEYAFECLSDDRLYRYWDATDCVAFLLGMTEQALQQDLREETRFLVAYDRACREVNDRFDLRSNALATLLLSAFQQHGTVSQNRRKQFVHLVPEAAFDFIEDVVRRHWPRS